MVHCSWVLFRKYGNFIDNLRLFTRGGSGGMGYPRLGGEGGKGGDVWVVAQNRMTLKQLKDKYPQKRFVAGVGANSKFPNAGKSSLLSRVSHAKPAIADYAFTTLKPELGKIMYSDFKQISVADLPGLIEGAHMNKGMGHKFLKHIERTRQLLFVVDISGFQLSSHTQYRTAFETIILLTKELELYKEELQTKPALLAVNKMDLPDAQDKFHELMSQLQNPKDFLHLFGKNMIPERTVEFQHIIPISAVTGEGIEELKNCIRKSLDEQANQENDAHHKKQLLNLWISDTVSSSEPPSKHAVTTSKMDII
ncbi:GTP-binding protein 10 isoform X3 [Symphalangus syndactylus]|uniref:GTP-binding protein 10 isoform X3 n=1 Tax=Symphalangus syndactylus TaxID=9590 RepID=UPI0024415C4F|nr:GTP-binding protein 10 isoform X3 [Symphalangus syndactylus]